MTCRDKKTDLQKACKKKDGPDLSIRLSMKKKKVKIYMMKKQLHLFCKAFALFAY